MASQASFLRPFGLRDQDELGAVTVLRDDDMHRGIVNDVTELSARGRHFLAHGRPANELILAVSCTDDTSNMGVSASQARLSLRPSLPWSLPRGRRPRCRASAPLQFVTSSLS